MGTSHCCTLREEAKSSPTLPRGLGSADGIQSEGKLLDKYKLGAILGQGAFGVVYECTQLTTKEKFAVKMIDKVESPMADIKREIEMLALLRHPTVVGLYDVYYEKVFCYVVVQYLKGGDMIQGMQDHWKDHGMIPIDSVRRVSAMMCASIAWLHSKKCVHRDIKGDNFLMDRKKIQDPEVVIVLSDFGTVMLLQPGEKMKKSCGTKAYWAPEFYKMNYGLKVDVFATGVVMFGLCSGKFPFRSEEDANKKKVVLPSRCPEEGQILIKKMLEKREDTRIDAEQARDDPWFACEKVNKEEAKDLAVDAGFTPEVKEFGANAGIVQRRAELVKRVEDAQERGEKLWFSFDQMSSDFQIVCPAKRMVKYKWWPKDKFANANKQLETAKPAPKDDLVQASAQHTKQMLEDHGVSLSLFGIGKAKTFDEFVGEVAEGSARLMLDSAKFKTVVRVVDVVLLRIFVETEQGKLYCIDVAEKYSDGRENFGLHVLPGAKILPHENARQTARRVIEDRLNMADCKVEFVQHPKEEYEEAEDSPSYPGVQTVYRKEFVEAVVKTTNVGILERIGVITASGRRASFSAEDSKHITRTYAWMDEAKCAEINVKMKPLKETADVSALVNAPIGLDEDALKKFFKANGVDETAFGQGGTRTLEQFSHELVSGEATLQTGSDGKVKRIVDVLVLKVTKPNGEVLMETEETSGDGELKVLDRLPAVKRRSDENQFWAAHRLIGQLHLDMNFIKLNTSNVMILEETKSSTAYPGSIQTLYQKRIISAELAA